MKIMAVIGHARNVSKSVMTDESLYVLKPWQMFPDSTYLSGPRLVDFGCLGPICMDL